MKKLLPLAFLLLFSCKTSRESTQSPPPVLNNAPRWTQEKPIDPFNFIGIGYQSTWIPNYQKLAQKNALEDLASEIKVSLSANSFLYKMDKESAFNEEYLSHVKTNVNNQIEGHELVDTWLDSTRHGYWAFYKLDKEKYYKSKEKLRNAAIASAYDQLQLGRTYEKQGAVLLALKSYLEVLDLLKNYWNEYLTFKEGENNIHLTSEAYWKIEDMISQLSFESPSNLFELPKLLKNTFDIPFQLTYRGQSINLPLKAYFTIGSGIASVKQGKNPELSISKITGSDLNQKITISIDWELLSPFEKGDFLGKIILSKLDRGLYEIALKVQSPKVWIHVDSFDTKFTTSVYSDIQHFLLQEGFLIAGSEEEASLWLDITCHSTSKNDEVVHYQVLDYHINLKNKEHTLYHKNNQIKAMHINTQKAYEKAYEELKSQIKIEISSLSKNVY